MANAKKIAEPRSYLDSSRGYDDPPRRHDDMPRGYMDTRRRYTDMQRGDTGPKIYTQIKEETSQMQYLLNCAELWRSGKPAVVLTIFVAMYRLRDSIKPSSG